MEQAPTLVARRRTYSNSGNRTTWPTSEVPFPKHAQSASCRVSYSTWITLKNGNAHGKSYNSLGLKKWKLLCMGFKLIVLFSVNRKAKVLEWNNTITPCWATSNIIPNGATVDISNISLSISHCKQTLIHYLVPYWQCILPVSLASSSLCIELLNHFAIKFCDYCWFVASLFSEYHNMVENLYQSWLYLAYLKTKNGYFLEKCSRRTHNNVFN